MQPQQHDLGLLESLVWVEWPRAHYPSSQTLFLSQRCQQKQITHTNGCVPLAFTVDWALLVFSSNGSKVIFRRPDFYTLVLDNCQQSIIVTKGRVSLYPNQKRRADLVTVIRVSQQASGCGTCLQWRGKPNKVVKTSGPRKARHTAQDMAAAWMRRWPRPRAWA